MTAGMATASPRAVVTNASEIPPATAPRPVALCFAISENAFKMPTTVPNSPTNGSAESAPQFSVNGGLGTVQGALGGFDFLARDFIGFAVRSEFHQAGGHSLG